MRPPTGDEGVVVVPLEQQSRRRGVRSPTRGIRAGRVDGGGGCCRYRRSSRGGACCCAMFCVGVPRIMGGDLDLSEVPVVGKWMGGGDKEEEGDKGGPAVVVVAPRPTGEGGSSSSPPPDLDVLSGNPAFNRPSGSKGEEVGGSLAAEASEPRICSGVFVDCGDGLHGHMAPFEVDSNMYVFGGLKGVKNDGGAGPGRFVMRLVDSDGEPYGFPRYTQDGGLTSVEDATVEVWEGGSLIIGGDGGGSRYTVSYVEPCKPTTILRRGVMPRPPTRPHPPRRCCSRCRRRRHRARRPARPPRWPTPRSSARRQRQGDGVLRGVRVEPN